MQMQNYEDAFGSHTLTQEFDRQMHPFRHDAANYYYSQQLNPVSQHSK